MAELIQIGALQVRFLRTKHDTGGALDMFEAMVPANARMPVPHHHRDWEETIYGLEGIVTFTVAGERIEVAPGDDVFIPRGVVHGFVNEGRAPAKMLCLLTPGVLGPEYFREMAALVGGPTPPDPLKMAETMKRHGLIPARLPENLSMRDSRATHSNRADFRRPTRFDSLVRLGTKRKCRAALGGSGAGGRPPAPSAAGDSRP